MAKKITFEDVSAEEFWKQISKHYSNFFAGRRSGGGAFALSKKEQAQLKKLSENRSDLYRIHFLAKLNGQLIGWHFGVQFSENTFEMKNTAILEKYRGQGYYTQILKEVLNRTKKEGFQIVSSRHHGNNASVLIPKLRAGFVLTGAEFDERFGALFTMKYFFNAKMAKEFAKNIGNCIL